MPSTRLSCRMLEQHIGQMHLLKRMECIRHSPEDPPFTSHITCHRVSAHVGSHAGGIRWRPSAASQPSRGVGLTTRKDCTVFLLGITEPALRTCPCGIRRDVSKYFPRSPTTDLPLTESRRSAGNLEHPTRHLVNSKSCVLFPRHGRNAGDWQFS
jgi:hypothetical protein